MEENLLLAAWREFRMRQFSRVYRTFGNLVREYDGSLLTPGKGSRLRILFWPFRAHLRVLMPEVILATALRMRGHEAALFFCDGAWDRCISMCAGQDEALICRRCQREVGLTESYSGIPILHAENYIQTDEWSRWAEIEKNLPVEQMLNYEHKGIGVGNAVRATALAYLLKGDLDLEQDAEVIRKYFRIALQIIETAERVLDKYQPDRLVMSHGVYTPWALVKELADQRGIPVLVWRTGFRRNTIGLSRGLYWSPGALTASEWDHPLSEADRDIFDQYLGVRANGTAYWAANPHPMSNQDTILRELKLDPRKKVAVLYTNVAWDAGAFWGNAFFRSILDWLIVSVKWFANQSDWQLVVRIHPGELQKGLESRQNAMDTLAELGTLPSVIKIVPPESNISSYILGNLANVCLVFSSNMGIEMAVRGKPVVVAGDAVYRGQGFTVDIHSRQEYLALLDQLDSLEPLKLETQEAARRFTYHVIFRLCVPFAPLNLVDPTVNRVTWRDWPKHIRERLFSIPVDLKFSSMTDLEPGNYPSLDLLCESIIHGITAVCDPLTISSEITF